MTTITVNAKALLAAHLYTASPKDSRLNLQGVFVVPADKGINVIGCNGHQILVVSDESGTCTATNGVILPLSSQIVSDLKKNAGKYDGTARFNPGMVGRLELAGENGSRFALDPVDMQYPDWKQVISPNAPTSSCLAKSCASAYLAAIHAACIALGTAKNPAAVTLYPGEPNRQLWFELSTFNLTAYGCIMPVRSANKHTETAMGNNPLLADKAA